MKKRVFAYFDKQLECTGEPKLTPVSREELVEGCIRSIIKADPDNLNGFKGQKLLLLGEYDDTKGFILEDPQFTVILDCDEVIQKYYGKYSESEASNN